MIVKSNSKYPEMISLFTEKDLILSLKKISDNDFTSVNNLYGTAKEPNNNLFKLLWQPLEKYLNGIKTVFYSPDGLLHNVSFAAIGNGKNGFLSDSYNLIQLGSTSKICLNEKTSFNINPTVGIYGGIKYSTDTTSFKLWQYLPGTKIEADKICKILDSKGIKYNYLTDANATEKQFKDSAGFYNLLHIATHGFFYPDQDLLKTNREKKLAELKYGFLDNLNCYGLWEFVKNKNPLMRSGLALAYANNVWNQRFPSEDDDGVITASEVAQLDLNKTQLVVLSACETGLGDVSGSEGVYGLQRAFKMAGVNYIIMSLWQVPDKETMEFMTLFYENLWASKDIRKSFINTQKVMQTKYDPYYWAAFVLIE
jgi:CHAT domain-containing protein